MTDEDLDLYTPPTTTIEDRNYLKLDINVYRQWASNVHNSYMNRQKQILPLKSAPVKKLKNMRHLIKKSKFLMQSLIWKAQLHSIEAELRRRKATFRR